MTHTVQPFGVVYTHKLACTRTAICHTEGRPIHPCADAQLIEVYLLVCTRVRGAHPSCSIEWILLKD